VVYIVWQRRRYGMLAFAAELDAPNASRLQLKCHNLVHRSYNDDVKAPNASDA
jgi:hypothetical protein